MAEGRGRRGGRPELHRRGFRAGRPLDDDDNDDFDDEAGGQRARHMREIRGNRDDRDERDNRRPRNDQDGGRRNDRDNRRDDRGAGRRDVGRGRNRGQGGNEGGRPGRKLILSECFMRDDLVKRDPANIVLTLSSPQTAFREALIECVKKTNMLKIMLSVLAKAFKCKSTPEQFNRAYIIIEESRFFDNVASYFLDMQAEDSYIRQLEFKQPIHDMICVMEGLVDKNPTSITQFVGIHDILKTVIDNLRERSTVIDDDLLKSFSAFTERKELLLKRGMGKRVEPEMKASDDTLLYDEPPDDFREIPIFPENADMQVDNDRYLRVNKVKGRYQDIDHYLDVQFRLLREDFVSPLREGISNYIQDMEENPRKKHKSHDVRMYNNVRLIAPDSRDNGLCHILQFDVSGLGRVIWSSTKRLIYGSLLCLSSDNFRTYHFATVMNRDPKLVSKGLVSVHFEHEQAVVRHLVGQVFTMAETTAYFESYRHVLKGLQNIRDGDLPFERYIIQCERLVHAPEYIRRRPDVKYDLRPLVDEDMIIIDNIRLGENIGELEERVAEHKFTEQSMPAKEVSVLDQRNWPPSDLLHLDESQYRAIRTALTKEFAITQGPPGTGKTYIGLKIVKALLHNKSVWSKHPDTGEDDPRPMLIVCYTNHALDQFLEGIDRFYKGDIVRVGSRSTSEILKPYGLHNFRQRFRHAQKIPAAVYRGRREAKNEMESVMSEILQVSAVIQQANTCIIHEKVLRNHMGRHYNLLMDQFHDIMDNYDAGEYFDSNRSIIVEWLELGNLQPIVEMEGNISDDEQMIPNEDPDENLIDVDFEVDAIQEQRQLDNQSDDDDDDGDDLIDERDLTRRERLEQRVQQNVFDNRHNVALDVESIAEKPKNVQANEWEIQKGQKKKMKKKLQKNLASGDIMMEEEANRCTNLWKMKIGRKWRLYRLWVLKYSDHLRSLINEKEDEFDAAAKRYQEALMQEDKEILKNSTIIGMTTTGAAKYQRVLQELKPRIIVVEEAAEVLEAHVVTTLSRGCEHLVLIGDHKQLKPNPTVYKLATDYNLDVSLFERMVENGIRCDCLELQHRMKPEISELMKHIYENLRDHDDVKKYEAIKGIACNMFFIDHKNEESHNEDLRSHSNVHEANYIKHLCKYLLLQGYRPEQITVLTLYSGQLFCLRRMMPKDEFNGVRVTVVDNYQGEENDIILLSLVRSNNEGNIGFLKIENRVCVALSRAKKGFYVIGNFDLLKSQSKLWNEIVIDMKNKDRIGEGLELYCQNHPDNDRIVAKEPTDFLRAPEGGCNQKCTYRLDCGHVCEMYCHVTDQEHANYDCHKKCGKTICKNGHKCQLRCGSKCSPCLEMVPRQLPKCGHVQQTPCSGDVNEFECKAKCKDILRCGHKCQAPCGRAHTQNCNEGIRKIWPCGHEGIIACYQKDTALCPAPCDSQLDCDHRCSGTCGECFQGRLHKPCSNDCIRILVCGHECTDTCNQCPPCTRKCENRCAHSKCNRGCGELCTPCMEPCEWQCEHYQCEKLCSEPCDRPRCDQPCRKDLKCGHQCIGLCGEPCPPDCKECDKEKVTTILFGEEDEPYARFVLMEDCRAKCIIESGAMDKYMDDIVGTEIKLRECPLCKTTIRKSNRYKEKINRTLQDIEGVKKNVLHNMGNVRELEGKIQDALKDELPAGVKLKLKRRFKSLPEPKSQNALVAISNQIAFVKEVTKLEEEWKERVRLLMFNEDKLQQLRFIQHFKDWLMIERTNMSPQENRDAEFEISRAKAYLLLLLHQQKAKEISKILDRGLQAKIAEAEKLVKGPHKYQENLRLKVEACLTELKNCCPLTNLGISEKERLEIVTATKLPTGHWFKCPNGHIYAIGECGGANETSKCPECGCTIGGTNHHLQDDNQLANEMDGAQHAAWSEQANLLNYGFNAQF